MKLHCPNGHAMNWDITECPKCGEDVSAKAVIKSWLFTIKHFPLIQCVNVDCERAYPLSYPECPFCETKNTISNAAKSIVVPMRDRARLLVNAPKAQTKRKFQRLYLVASVIFLFAVLVSLTGTSDDDVVMFAGVAVIYLACIALLVRWFVPQNIIITFLQRTNWVVKLALVFNYFASLLIMQRAIATWWAQFAALAVLVVSTWLGAWVFCSLFWPMNYNLKSIFLEEKKDRTLNPMDDQGRDGFEDRF